MSKSLDARKQHQERHGMKHTPEYKTWCDMKARCLNPNNKNFETYSKRGICKEWVESFKAFYRDMGPRPSPKHSIDRINNDGPYAPDNCRWATQPEQVRNRSNNINLTFQGRTQCVAAWAEELGMKNTTLQLRITKYGWSVERALTTPVCVGLEYNGRTQTQAEWAAEIGLTLNGLRKRLNNGWSVERALTTPSRQRKAKGA